LVDKQSGRPLAKLDRALCLDKQRYLVTHPPDPSADPLILHEVELTYDDANEPHPRRLFENASLDARRRVRLELADLDRVNLAGRFVAQLRHDGCLFAAYARQDAHDGQAPRARVADMGSESRGVRRRVVAPSAAASTAAPVQPSEDAAAVTAGRGVGSAAETVGAGVAVSGARLPFEPPAQLNEHIYVSRSPRPGEDGGWAEELVAWAAANHGKNLCVFDVGCEVAYSPALFEYRVQRHPPPADAEEGCILFSDVADFCRRLETWLKVGPGPIRWSRAYLSHRPELRLCACM
jgi:hypothetical protein